MRLANRKPEERQCQATSIPHLAQTIGDFTPDDDARFA